MNKPKIGIVGVCSHYESGAQRYDELIGGAQTELTKAGLDVVCADDKIYTPADAIAACEKFKAAKIDTLVIMDVTWVCDSLKYVFIKELGLPTLFWAVPYTETFSIGCIQNFGSVLKAQGIHYEYVYGLPTDAALVERVVKVALAGQIVGKVKGMRIALVGPRQTWRVGGSQDMTMEEWDFSRVVGPTILHYEMEEITDAAEKISDADAQKTLDSLKGRTGKSLCSEETMLWMAKVYMATKAMIQENGLNAIAAECYPNYSGLMNLTSSWLADDGIIVDTEGDIANAVLQYMLNLAAGGGACALGEVGSFSDEEDYMGIAHEGSTAASLAESVDKIQISPSGKRGCFVGLPVKLLDICTVCDMQGVNGQYQMMISKGSTLPASHDEWVDGGEKLLIKLRLEGIKPGAAIEKMLEAGLHHHLIIKNGDHSDVLSAACKFMGVKVVHI